LNATTGVLYACGSNGYGELGNGNTTNQSSFVTSIASGCVDVYACGFSSYNSTFAKLSDGRLVGCGYNGNGVLGTGLATFPTTISSWVDIPRPVGNVVDFDAVYDLSARNDGMLLVQMDDGGLYACGLNVNNALSINDDAMGYITDTLTPVQLIYK
jgi:alpha-tubulin suppressor-like RCC1 family protein